MDSPGKIIAEYAPASAVCTLLLPGWLSQPQVVARSDGRDVVTVEVSQCHPNEEWRLVMLRKGRLCVVPLLSGQAQQRPQLTVYDAVVMVPPDQIEAFQVFIGSSEGQ
jgi:hypothetical protein